MERIPGWSHVERVQLTELSWVFRCRSERGESNTKITIPNNELARKFNSIVYCYFCYLAAFPARTPRRCSFLPPPSPRENQDCDNLDQVSTLPASPTQRALLGTTTEQQTRRSLTDPAKASSPGWRQRRSEGRLSRQGARLTL